MVQVNLPVVRSESIYLSCGIFLMAFIIGSFFYQKMHPFFKQQSENLEASFNRDYFKYFLHICALVSGLLIILSISYSMYTFKEIVFAQGGFGLRAISTSLHKLVPLESRWIFLLGPWTFLLVGEKNKKINILRLLNIFVWMILIFLTQTKINFLLIAAFFVTFYGYEMLKQFSLKKLAVLCFILIVSYLSLNFIILKTAEGKDLVINNDKVKSMNVENTWEQTPPTEKCNSYKQEAKNETQFVNEMSFSISSFIGSINGRIFGVAQRASGVFFCLRDFGNWRPAFRGHQLARLLGLYKPVNRWAIQSMDPIHGSSAVASAVANFVSDGYFNGGYIGVFFASIFSFMGWIFLKMLSEMNSSQSMYFLYIRYQYCLLLMTQSFITSLVTILFLVLIYLGGVITKNIYERVK
jgi:hypothetical protein